MTGRSRFHTDRNELIPVASWPYLPVALAERLVAPRFDRPWFNHRAIRFLNGRIVPGTRILEVGAGGSTAWYAAKGAHVDAIDGQPDWYEKITAANAGNPNVTVTFVPETDIVEHLRSIRGGYDIVVLDTLDAVGRCAAAEVIRDNHPDSIIGVDDQDWEGHRPIDDIFSDWYVRRFAGMKARPFHAFETNFFRRTPF
jgi:hypothetical protein